MLILRLMRSHALVLLLVAFVWLALSRARPAEANSIVVSTLNDELTTNGQCSLREAVANAGLNSQTYPDCAAGSGNDRISFSVAGTLLLSSTLSTIGVIDTAGLTIDGANSMTLSGGDAIRLFAVNAGVPLTLSNLVLTNGYSGGSDGGVAVVNGGTLVLDHATIQNSHCACGAGSAILASGGSVSLLNGSVVQDNYGAAYAAINSTGAVTIVNSFVRRNSATSGGGALSVSGPVLISNSQIMSNSAPLGGGLYLGGSVLIANSQLANNTATSGSGGGINALAGSRVTVDSSLFATNVATGTGSPNGGAIYSEGNLTLTNVSLSGNFASQRGGGIEIIGTLSAKNSSLSDNRAYHGGGIADDGGTSSLVAVSLSSNHADGFGGGIINFATTILVASNLSGNSASHGGGIENGGTMALTDVTLSGNAAVDDGGISNAGMLTLISGIVSANHADQSGGGIGNDGALYIYNSTLSGNSGHFGGGIFNGRTLNLANSTLSGNVATSGGGIYNWNVGDATLTNVTLDNQVPPTGTAHNLYLAAGVLTLTNSIVNFDAASGANCFGAGAPKSVSRGHNLANDTSCGLTFTGDQQGPQVPVLLGVLANHGGPTLTQLPRAGSAAIDAGDNAVCAGVPINNLDQRGVLRPLDGNGDGIAICDIGAVERRPSDTDSVPWLWLPLIVR